MALGTSKVKPMQCDESIRRMLDDHPSNATVTYLSEYRKRNVNSKIDYLPIERKKPSLRDKLEPWMAVLLFILLTGLLEGLIGR